MLNAKPLDYSKKENWIINTSDKKGTDYDLIFFIGTSIFKSSQENGVGSDFAQQRILGTRSYKTLGSSLDDNARVFVPVQRQISLERALSINNHDALLHDIASKEPFIDVCAALDYYFEHYNNGRPFVLAGHSQGGSVCQILLKEYFLKTEKRKHLKNLVCLYSLGFGVSKTWFDSLVNKEKYIHLAEGESDFNCIVSWNLEGPGEKGSSMLLLDKPFDTYLINPLNWKVDETYASKDLNKGVYISDGKPLGEAKYFLTNEDKYLFDAQIDLKRGSLITTCCTDYLKLPKVGALWGGKSLHNYDAGAFYQNLKENVRVRVNNFLNNK